MLADVAMGTVSIANAPIRQLLHGDVYNVQSGSHCCLSAWYCWQGLSPSLLVAQAISALAAHVVTGSANAVRAATSASNKRASGVGIVDHIPVGCKRKVKRKGGRRKKAAADPNALPSRITDLRLRHHAEAVLPSKLVQGAFGAAVSGADAALNEREPLAKPQISLTRGGACSGAHQERPEKGNPQQVLIMISQSMRIHPPFITSIPVRRRLEFAEQSWRRWEPM